MILFILIIALIVWGWKKYATSQSKEGTLYARYPKVAYYWIILALLAGLEIISSWNGSNKIMDSLTHDYVNDISNLFGLDYFYSLLKSMPEYDNYTSELFSYASEVSAPLVTAATWTTIINLFVIGVCGYNYVKLPKGEIAQSKVLRFGLWSGVAVVISYFWFGYGYGMTVSRIGICDYSPFISAIYVVFIPAAVVIFMYKKHKKAIEDVFENNLETADSQQKIQEVPIQNAIDYSATKNCPYCGEVVLAVAKKCKHCGEWFKEENKPEVKMTVCPICGEDIEVGTTICPHCNEQINID